MSDCNCKEFGGFAEVPGRPPRASAAICCGSNLALPVVLPLRSVAVVACSPLCSIAVHGNPIWRPLAASSPGSCCRNSITISVLTLLSSFAQLQFFALMKILNSMLSKRAWVERKSVLEPLLLETKQFSSTTLRMKVFPCSFFVRLQCFLPPLVL